MAFDPTLPAAHSEITAPELRAQFNALNDKIGAVPAGPAGPPGSAGPPIPGLNFLGDWNGGTSYGAGDVVFHDGQAFVAIGVSQATTPEGDMQRWRTLTIAGPPGEVTSAQLANEISGTARNPSGVSAPGLAVSDPPTQAEMQALAAKVAELLAALRR